MGLQGDVQDLQSLLETKEKMLEDKNQEISQLKQGHIDKDKEVDS